MFLRDCGIAIPFEKCCTIISPRVNNVIFTFFTKLNSLSMAKTKQNKTKIIQRCFLVLEDNKTLEANQCVDYK